MLARLVATIRDNIYNWLYSTRVQTREVSDTGTVKNTIDKAKVVKEVKAVKEIAGIPDKKHSLTLLTLAI
jgi:hypothetical protein